MLDDVVATYGSRLIPAVGGVALALICLFFVLRFIRNRAPSPFVRGGRNRQPRLQVLDAAAVDARRRLVLVRRDGIEHLILIGGPTDIVVESGIDPNRETASTPAASFEALSSSEPLTFARPEPTRETPPRREQQPAAIAKEPVAPPQQPAPRRPEPVAADPDIYTPAVAVLDTPQRREPTAEPQRVPQNGNGLERPYAPAPAQASAAAFQAPEVTMVESPAAAEAADILDSVRDRVLPPQPARPSPAPQVVTPPAQSLPVADHGAPVTPSDSNIRPMIPPMATAGPAVDIQPQLREPTTDFQSVLDEEMSSNLTAERFTPNTTATTQLPRPGQGPRRERELPPITGADSALQKEVARIFGEMSVNRDK